MPAATLVAVMAETPNIVWLTLDSVRVDHTSMGGYRRDTTPHLQRVADSSEGEWYSNCSAHANSTRVSVPSIITGTYPSHHGVRGNLTLPDELETVPEILSRNGYHTIGLSRNANSSMGFDRGFDEFKWISSDTFLSAVDFSTIVKYTLNIRRHSAGFATDTAKHATPFVLNDMAKRRVKSCAGSDEPFFLYLHYNETHRPYFPPLPYLDRYTDKIAMTAEEVAEFAMEMHYNCDEIIADGTNFSEDEWDALHAMYDAEIAYTDECVGRLFDYVRSLNIGETIFIITADHGELFGEQGMLAHKIVLHDHLINVPLVTHGFDDVSCTSVDLLQHADLMETLVSMVGGNTAQFQGVNLRSESREYVISQTWGAEEYLQYLRDINPEFDDSSYYKSLLTCVRDEEFKYQESKDRSELFVLPDETTDVSDQHPQKVDELSRFLEDWFESDGQPVSTTERRGEFTDAMKEQLADLGYLVE